MSAVTGGIPLPALTPNNDTKLNLDDLIDHSHDAPANQEKRHGLWRGRPRRQRRARNRDAVMPLADHLIEFRKRFVLSALGIAIMSVVGWMFSEPVFRILQQPFQTAAAQQNGLMSITFNGVVSAFNVRLEIAFFLGLVASCPWWSYQLWAFINPGLKRKERWTAVAFIAASVPLFLAGAGLAWYFLPQAVAILTGFAPADTATLLSADVYFDFILRMTLAFGLAFLLPVVMVALTMMNVVGSKAWLKQWRVAVLVAFVFAAVATPTGDVGTLCALALPICVIYFAAIAVCWGYERVQLYHIMRLSGYEPRIVRVWHAVRAKLSAVPGVRALTARRAARRAMKAGAAGEDATIDTATTTKE